MSKKTEIDILKEKLSEKLEELKYLKAEFKNANNAFLEYKRNIENSCIQLSLYEKINTLKEIRQQFLDLLDKLKTSELNLYKNLDEFNK